MSYKDDVLNYSYILRLDATLVDEDVNGYYKVAWSEKILKPDNGTSGRYADGPHGWSVNIGGQTASGSKADYDFRNYSTLTLGSGPGALIKHNADGSAKTITVSCTFDDNNTWGELGNGGVSFQMTLPAIGSKPPAPSPIGLDTITATSMRYRFSSNGNGGLPIIRWEYQYSTSSTFSSGNSALLTSSGTSTPTGLKSFTKYYFRSRGVNSLGAGAWSSIISATTLGVPSKPATPVLTSTTAYSIRVSITDPAANGSAITARETQLSKVPTFASIVATDTTTAPYWTESLGVERNVQFYVRTRMKNTAGWSAWSGTLAVKTPLMVPSTPTGYGIIDLASTTVYITLPAIADNGGAPVTDLRAQVNTTQSDVGATTVLSGGFWPLFLSQLTPGASYFVRLAASNAAGWSGYGPWIAFSMKTNVPLPPLNLGISGLTDASAVVVWDPPADLLGAEISSFTVRLATTKAFSSGLQTFTLGADAISQVFVGLTKGTKYVVQVWTNTSAGVGSFTDPLPFETPGAVSGDGLVWFSVGGVQHRAQPWLSVGGVQHRVLPWLRVDGVWKRGA